MSFEIVTKDILGRIGKLRTKRGVVETPVLLPVINPLLQPISPREMRNDFGCKAIITNAYLLKKNFGADPVFDLARLEATAPDGHLTTFEQGGQSYLSLYSGYAEDEGHLNTLGQQVVGAGAIKFMAEGLKRRNAAR